MKSDEEKFLEAMKIILGPHRKIGVCDDCGLYRLIQLNEEGEPKKGQKFCPECGKPWRM